MTAPTRSSEEGNIHTRHTQTPQPPQQGCPGRPLSQSLNYPNKVVFIPSRAPDSVPQPPGKRFSVHVESTRGRDIHIHGLIVPVPPLEPWAGQPPGGVAALRVPLAVRTAGDNGQTGDRLLSSSPVL